MDGGYRFPRGSGFRGREEQMGFYRQMISQRIVGVIGFPFGQATHAQETLVPLEKIEFVSLLSNKRAGVMIITMEWDVADEVHEWLEPEILRDPPRPTRPTFQAQVITFAARSATDQMFKLTPGEVYVGSTLALGELIHITATQSRRPV